ncbi:MAG: hypothetical protein COV52_09860 [Gammaproteobacteria bacterium CG11_big_fil_rev_8_21_14_0_20_46_22]|nr:MAG: hypothetical protein COV52_09860 [Gammaproteobacteria bacterium CG11_big_fil_rev_8_21_14_0_20_46_22]
MLQFIRDKSQGVIATVILGLLALSFALWGIHNYFDSSGQNATVVTVNGQDISSQSFSATLQRAQAQAQRMGYQINTQSALNAFKKHVLDNMVMMTLLHQSAVKNGFAVSPDLLELTLARLPMLQQGGVFSKKRFMNFLQSTGYSQEQFLSTLSSSLQLQQVQNGMVETAFSLSYMTERAVGLVHQTRSFAYTLIPASAYRSDVKVTPSEAQVYYKANTQAFTIPQKVSVDYLELSLSAVESHIKPTDAQLQAFYRGNIALFSVPMQWKVSRIEVPLSDGASDREVATAKEKAQAIEQALSKNSARFGEFAKQYPAQDSLGNGGWVSLMEVPEVMQAALVKLKHPGELSSVLTLPNGFELIKVLAVKPSKVYPYDDIKARVRKMYIQQTAQKQYSTAVDRLSSLTFEHPESLAPAAKALGLSVKKSPLFSEKEKTGMFANPALLSSAFSQDVLINGNNSDLINIDDTHVMVLRLNQKIPATVKPFDEVSATIYNTLVQEKSAEMAQAKATKLLGELHGARDLSAIAKKEGLSAHQVDHVNRNTQSKSLPALLVETAFSLPVPYHSRYPATSIKMPNGDSAVLVLSGVKQGRLSDFPDSVNQAFARAQVADAGRLDYALYLHGLKQAANIKYRKLN